MELPKRKSIRLPDYNYSSPGAYFVTICTQNRRRILSAISVGAAALGGPSVGADTPGGPSVGADAPGGPSVGADAPGSPSVGADALGGPCLQLTDTGKVVEQHILSADRIPGFHVDKYVIMPNHIHMILRIDREAAYSDSGPPRAAAPTVSDAVGALKRLVNRQVGENIWQRSFHEHVIRNENDYLEIWEYIENNPVKWVEDRYYEP